MGRCLEGETHTNTYDHKGTRLRISKSEAMIKLAGYNQGLLNQIDDVPASAARSSQLVANVVESRHHLGVNICVQIRMLNAWTGAQVFFQVP
ncbi:unnamed protein product [Strongylus vulgaris]|uniref:Uncharacterized protein n=1 Tax=Strongylus vulgaris TaxID=40348 RepID=A0A3P7LB19_STRVU|nr:unnamed protein product [Strongylus vulgaris]